MKWSMNKTEVRALYPLLNEKMTVLELANALSMSLSWTSESVHHLELLGVVKREKVKNYVFVSLSTTSLGNSLSLLIQEEPMLNLEAMFTQSGLKVLPLLLKPGCSTKELVTRSGLSLRSVKGLLPRWRKMGVVLHNEGIYMINPRYKLLADFLRKFSEYKNACFLNEIFPQAVIVWQWRDEFVFSLDQKVNDSRFVPAGVSRLDELDYDLVHVNEYYFYNVYKIYKIQVSEEEALVQALYIDPNNPRIRKLFKIHKNYVDYEKLFEYANKYGLKTRIRGIVMPDDRKKEIRKG